MLKIVDLRYFDQPSYIWVKILFRTYSMFFVLYEEDVESFVEIR